MIGQWPRDAARAMATKMSGRLTVQERAQIVARYEEWNSVVAVQRWWLTVKGRNATIRQETIKNCHSKFLTTRSVTDVWSEMAVHPHPDLIRTWRLCGIRSSAARVN
jgi:hypothetical protein